MKNQPCNQFRDFHHSYAYYTLNRNMILEMFYYDLICSLISKYRSQVFKFIFIIISTYYLAIESKTFLQ